MQLECFFATRRSFLHTSDSKICPKPSKSTVWTVTQWLPPHPLLSCYWWPQRRLQRLASLTPPRRSCWTMPGAATLPWMRRHWAGCRPWKKITCSCPSLTGSDTEGRRTEEWEVSLDDSEADGESEEKKQLVSSAAGKLTFKAQWSHGKWGKFLLWQCPSYGHVKCSWHPQKSKIFTSDSLFLSISCIEMSVSLINPHHSFSDTEDIG